MQNAIQGGEKISPGRWTNQTPYKIELWLPTITTRPPRASLGIYKDSGIVYVPISIWALSISTSLESLKQWAGGWRGVQPHQKVMFLHIMYLCRAVDLGFGMTQNRCHGILGGTG